MIQQASEASFLLCVNLQQHIWHHGFVQLDFTFFYIKFASTLKLLLPSALVDIQALYKV